MKNVLITVHLYEFVTSRTGVDVGRPLLSMGMGKYFVLCLGTRKYQPHSQAFPTMKKFEIRKSDRMSAVYNHGRSKKDPRN